MALHAAASDLDRPSTVAVAIDKDKVSPNAVRWAINNLLVPDDTLTLVHVIPPKNGLAEVDGAQDVNVEPKDVDLQEVFAPFAVYCARKAIAIKEVVLEDTNIPKAILNYVSSNLVANIVVGASTRKALTRKFKNHDISSLLNRYAPDFCSVYVIGKSKAVSIKPASRPLANTATPPRLPSPRGSHSPFAPSDLSELADGGRARSLRISTRKDRTRNSPTNLSLDLDDLVQGLSSKVKLFTGDGEFPNPSPCDTGSIDFSCQNLDFGSIPKSPSPIVPKSPHEAIFPSPLAKDTEAEMKRLKHELKQTIELYSTACKEAVSAKKKANELQLWKMEETRRFEQARLSEEAALAIAEKEKAKSRAALEAAEKAQKLAEIEAHRRKYAELKAKREAEEKNRALDVLSHNDVRYRKYTIQEIETATNHFSGSLKIGEGGYGPVFKGKLDHTPVAIKVLRPDAKQGRKQFQQEVEILSTIRHPNMVLLLGACPEYCCLVYEFMNYGSLEDRLFRKGNTHPLSWRTRFKIAADIATALLFLHQTKPEPLVHRDLKPANILLDRNFVCKISDVGLARLLLPSVADSVTQYHMTSAAGTFCYIDPEYQQTGKLGTKSDIYSLGVMLLQIITAKSPMGLTHHVARSIQNGTFADILDPAVPDWPVEAALQFATLALKCCELRKKDRPSLGSVILPELNRLRDLGKNSKSSDVSPNLNPLDV